MVPRHQQHPHQLRQHFLSVPWFLLDKAVPKGARSFALHNDWIKDWDLCIFLEEIPIHTAGPTFKKWVILCSVGLSCPLLALSLGNQTQPLSIDLSQCPLLFFYFLFVKVLCRRVWFETPYVAKDDLESLNLPLPPKHWSPVHTTTHVYVLGTHQRLSVSQISTWPTKFCMSSFFSF